MRATSASLDPSPGRSFRLRAAVAVVLLFWAAQYAIVTTVDRLVFDVAIIFLPRALISGAGAALSLVLVFARAWRPVRAPWARTSLTLLQALLGAVLQTSANYAIFARFIPDMRGDITAGVYLGDVFHWFWTYAALLGIVTALEYSGDLAERERRIATLDRTAQQAQLRALRYQLNPHFMFNTLNSIAALIDAGERAAAGAMVEDLADFLRATLSTDPGEDITLARELELQSLYLAIEARRFPDRLAVEMDVSAEAAGALVPSLITQPVTENVIRHAVAQSGRPVTMRVSGARIGDDLHLAVANSAPDGPSRATGTRLGLANVAERLRARFGAASAVEAAPGGDGGYVVRMILPFVRAP